MKQLLSLIFFLFVSSIFGYAQESETFMPPCLGFARSDLVFTGTVKGTEKDYDGRPSAVFVIDKKFKAPLELKTDVSSELIVGFPAGEESYEFVVGERYLVYASYDKIRNQIYIPLYSRTGKIGLNDYDLKYLSSRVNGRHTLSGRLIRLDENYAKKVKVKVRDEEGHQFKLEVDKWGMFETQPLTAGEYSVVLVLPYKINVHTPKGLIVESFSRFTKISYHAQVEIDKCAYKELSVSLDN